MTTLFHLLCLIASTHLVSGLVTLQSIKEITNLTKDCRIDIVRAALDGTSSVGFGGQVLFSGKNEDEVEDVSQFLQILHMSVRRLGDGLPEGKGGFY
jgi:hypothetical protein